MHPKVMNIYTASILATGLIVSSCEQGVFCTEEFRSVGFQWTGASLPDSVYTVNGRTGDTLTALDKGYEAYFAVVDDSHMKSLSAGGDSLRTTVLDSTGTVVASAWYVVGRDNCHIVFRSGPEFLP
ncbi:MAG: hypothetical protein RL558_168 [Bacteroidota bacterium]